MESEKQLKMKDVLYVPSLKKNLLSISGLEKKYFRVAFVDGQVLMWPKGKTIDDAIVIGVEEGGLYKLKESQIKHWYIAPSTQVNFGTKDLLTFTTEHYRS